MSTRERAATNRLAESTSPYLRQHAENPVDWYPWSDEALARAKAEDKPILLSVGYSACHWCHVMAHESFEDDATAGVLNRHFVSIKLDREERPDIDATYQKVVQLMGQGGGWPLTVFLTPALRPFYAGTYFPKQPRYGRPGFVQLLGAIVDLWANKRAEVEAQADDLARGVHALAGIVDEERAQAEGQVAPDDLGALRLAARRLIERVDPAWGGFGREPKFPNPTGLDLLLAVARGGDDDPLAREAMAALALTLDKMAAGGIYDHLRGGFARYAVDRIWLVPHFEKMLYDNAQLLPLYAEGSVRVHDRARWREVVRETVDYLVADMRDASGLFYAATDADSEGEEGKYFCWTPDEIASVLGDGARAREFCAVYGVTAAGNFEHGRSILHLRRPIEEVARELGGPPLGEAALRERLDRAKAELLAHRYGRVPPERDDKLITGWNALLVTGLCRAARAAERWGEPELAARMIELARTAGLRLVEHHVDADGRVLRAAFAGRVHTRGVIDDVATLARACLDLHAATLVPVWLDHARQLAERALDDYLRPGEDGFFMTAADVDAPLERPESQHDGPIPAGVSVMIEVLARLELAASTAGGASARARRVVERTLDRFRAAPAQPFAYASLLHAAAWASPRAVHVTVRGPAPTDATVRELGARARERALVTPEPVGLSFAVADSPAAIVCRAQVCSAPVSTLAELDAALSGRG